MERAATQRYADLDGRDSKRMPAPDESSPSSLTLRERIVADYRFYSGAFADPAQPRGGMLSRMWSASMKLGFWLLFSYRLRNAWMHRGAFLRRLAELIGLLTKIATGCHVSAKSTIGFNVSFPHPVGIVIGDEVVIRDGARIFQGVTLGSSDIGRDSYPILEEGVTLFANAVVVGRVTLGSNAVVGAGAIVLKNVPADCSAVGNPARVIRRNSSVPTPQGAAGPAAREGADEN